MRIWLRDAGRLGFVPRIRDDAQEVVTVTVIDSRPCQGAARLLRFATSLRVTRPPAAARMAVIAGRRFGRLSGPVTGSRSATSPRELIIANAY